MKVLRISSEWLSRRFESAAEVAEAGAARSAAALAPLPLAPLACTLVKKLRSSSFFFLKGFKPAGGEGGTKHQLYRASPMGL